MLWANLNYFPWRPNDDENSTYNSDANRANEVIENYDFDTEETCIIDSVYHSLLTLKDGGNCLIMDISVTYVIQNFLL